MKKYIIIKADTNDADYVTKKSDISDEDLENIKDIVKAIRGSKRNHNWPDGEYNEETLADLYPNFYELDRNEEYPEILAKTVTAEKFRNFVPHGEYGVHTIESIEILEVANEIKLL